VITNPNHEQIEALASLQHNRDFNTVIDWLKDNLEATRDQLMEEYDEVATRRAQGEAKNLSEILRMANDARTFIEKSKR